ELLAMAHQDRLEGQSGHLLLAVWPCFQIVTGVELFFLEQSRIAHFREIFQEAFYAWRPHYPQVLSALARVVVVQEKKGETGKVVPVEMADEDRRYVCGVFPQATEMR
ncbi:MAG TPA: hypothetical protein VNL15_05910, partial [Dehalococcoidia bacterium]|nr:hypothetical protein [Dehalococcoidia bacterium]